MLYECLYIDKGYVLWQQKVGGTKEIMFPPLQKVRIHVPPRPPLNSVHDAERQEGKL